MVLDNDLLEKTLIDLNKSIPKMKIVNIDSFYNIRTTDKNFEVQSSIYSDRELPLINLKKINKNNVPVDYSVNLENKIVAKIPGIIRLIEKKQKIDSHFVAIKKSEKKNKKKNKKKKKHRQEGIFNVRFLFRIFYWNFES